MKNYPRDEKLTPRHISVQGAKKLNYSAKLRKISEKHTFFKIYDDGFSEPVDDAVWRPDPARSSTG